MSLSKSKNLQEVQQESDNLDTAIGRLRAELKLSMKISNLMYYGKILDDFFQHSVIKCPNSNLSRDVIDKKASCFQLFAEPPPNLAKVFSDIIVKINQLGFSYEITLNRMDKILFTYYTLLHSFDRLEESIDNETILLLASRVPEVTDDDNKVINIFKCSIENLRTENFVSNVLM